MTNAPTTIEPERPTRSLWSVWAPLPLLVLLILDWTFPLYFWRIPKLTGRSADYGYQFLLDVHDMEARPASDSTRVLALGSSVAASFDPAQVQSLLGVELPHTPVDVHRLLKPAMKASDFRLFLSVNLAALHPDVVVLMFNIQDFLNPSFERDIKPDVQYVLPPWATLMQRHRFITLPESLDLLVASVSNFYRYRKPLRSAVEDHAQALAAWARSPVARGSYGIYPDAYTKRRFGLAVGDATTVDLDYFVDPAWIRQRGRVQLDFAMDGVSLATRVETEPGWKSLHLTLPPTGQRILHVTSDSAWTPRADGRTDDLRLLGVRLRSAPAAAPHSDPRPPFHYPPLDERDIDEFLRMGGVTGEAFLARWQAALDDQTDFGTRLRAWRDTRLELGDTAFEATGEYDQFERLVDDLARHGISVILVNTAENPLIGTYQHGAYYRGYLAFFERLAARDPGVRFYDEMTALPPEDFNDLMHVTYFGMLKLGPTYARMVAEAIGARRGDRAGDQNRT